MGFSGSTPHFAVARLNTNGSLDGSFGDNGKQSFDFDTNSFGNAVAIDYTGSLLTNPYFGTIVVAGIEGNIDPAAGVPARVITSNSPSLD